MALTDSQHDHLETTRGHAANCAGLDEWVKARTVARRVPYNPDRYAQDRPTIQESLGQLETVTTALRGAGLLR